jgi:hypothetical protein
MQEEGTDLETIGGDLGVNFACVAEISSWTAHRDSADHSTGGSDSFYYNKSCHFPLTTLLLQPTWCKLSFFKTVLLNKQGIYVHIYTTMRRRQKSKLSTFTLPTILYCRRSKITVL